MLGEPHKITDRHWSAYACWLALSLCSAAASLASLNAIERAETKALQRSVEAGAAAAEQRVLRLLDEAGSMRTTAADLVRGASAHMAQAGPDGSLNQNAETATIAGAAARLRTMVAQRSETLAFAALRRGGHIIWSSGTNSDGLVNTLAECAPSLGPKDTGSAPVSSNDADGKSPASHTAIPQLSMPSGSSGDGDRTVLACWTLGPEDGVAAGGTMAYFIVGLRVGALTASLGEPGELADTEWLLERRDDGAILARAPVRAGLPDGAAVLAAERASAGASFAVVEQLNRSAALADFTRLKTVALSALGVLILVALALMRLLLANEKLRSRLAAQALVDPLTGLHNRRFFTDVMAPRFALARDDGQSAAVLLIGLDGFKHVNDSRGQAVGDALLVKVAERLRALCGPDDHPMRLGGDEYVIVRLAGRLRRDAVLLARRVVEELPRRLAVDDVPVRISVSVGVSLLPESGTTLSDALNAADTALYFAKADGGDAYRLFACSMLETVQTRRALETDLRGAEQRGEFELLYQPLVHLQPRHVCGFEALLRWHHPRLGLIMPHRFIPIAEETGLINGIGEWVLREACRQAASWPGAARLAVNLSPVQFKRTDLADLVVRALADSGLAAHRLELEITESVALGDLGEVLFTMRRLRALGVRLALDDFGTGYASLSYLRSFPFDKVKIDASFLADLAGDGGTIVRAVLGLCGQMGLDSLVEGVETEAQLAWLQAEGCTEVQGHLFSPPCPAGRLAALIGPVDEGCAA